MSRRPLHLAASRRLPARLAVVLLLAVALWPPASSAQEKATPASGGDKVIGMVNGRKITEGDIRARAKQQFAKLARDYESSQHQLLASQLNVAIQDMLLEAEAASTGVSKEQLLAGIKAPEVTDADVDKFYQENKTKIPRAKEQVAADIKQYLQQHGQADARQRYFDGLAAKYPVEKRLEPLRAEVTTNGPAKGGPATAPVTIVEFSDFQCPFCSKLLPILEQVKTKYGDKVRIVFRQFPLPIHPNAQKAAEASLCANEQGKFWEMHDAMFKNQQELAVDNLKSKAATIGLKAEQFNSCIDSGKFAAQIKVDEDEGIAAGVSGTPAMFVNGRFINGLVSLDQVTQVVDDELRRKAAGL
jgi:protein-disulfide isomerase